MRITIMRFNVLWFGLVFRYPGSCTIERGVLAASFRDGRMEMLHSSNLASVYNAMSPFPLVVSTLAMTADVLEHPGLCSQRRSQAGSL